MIMKKVLRLSLSLFVLNQMMSISVFAVEKSPVVEEPSLDQICQTLAQMNGQGLGPWLTRFDGLNTDMGKFGFFGIPDIKTRMTYRTNMANLINEGVGLLEMYESFLNPHYNDTAENFSRRIDDLKRKLRYSMPKWRQMIKEEPTVDVNWRVNQDAHRDDILGIIKNKLEHVKAVNQLIYNCIERSGS